MRGESRELARARRRVRKMATHDLLEWLDTTIMGLGRALSDYRQEHQRESLLEMRDAGITALTALVDELLLRDEAARD